MTIFDSSGIEAYVTENNPKYTNRVIKQLYVDGHFCYVYKIGIVTNGLGIVCHLNLYNKDFLDSIDIYKELLNGDSFGNHDDGTCKTFQSAYIPLNSRSKLSAECEVPCTTSKCGRMFYIYPKQNLRAYPGTLRGTEEWDNTYGIRTTVERSINHFKYSFCLAERKTQNEKTLHADLILAGITQLVSVILADKIHRHQYIRSLKPLVTA